MMKRNSRSSDFWPLILLIASALVVSVATGLALGSAAEDLLIALALAGAIICGTGLVLYLVYRLSTGWLHARTTERIVIAQLATVVRQQLPLATGLSLAADGERGWAAIYLSRISRALADGLSLSEEVRLGYPDCSSIPLSLIMAGERSAQLPAALDQAETYLFERERHHPQDDVSIWTYLLILTAFTVLIVSGIMVAVIPKYKEIFRDFGTRLPAMTIGLIKVSEFTANWLPLFALLLVAVMVGVYLSLRPRRVPNPLIISRVADWIRWRFPGWRRIERGQGMRTVLEATRLGVRSGMDLGSAVRIAESVDVNSALRSRFWRFAELLERGVSAPEAARQTDLGEVTAIALATGQRDGDMDGALRYAADYHGSVASRWWVVLRNMVWPVWTVIMGIVVGAVVVSLFLPLVALINSVSG